MFEGIGEKFPERYSSWSRGCCVGVGVGGWYEYEKRRERARNR